MLRKKENTKNNKLKGKQFLTFKIADENYAINLMKAKEIINPPKIANVPDSADYVLGLINLRGQIVPVVDLKRKLGFENKNPLKGKEKKMVIVNTKDHLLSLLVDKTHDIENIKEKDIEKVSDTDTNVPKECIKGVSEREWGILIILDLEKLLYYDKKKEKNKNKEA